MAMGKTYAEQLTSVQTAIEEVELTGQSIDINGRTLTRGSLKELYRREARLRTLAAREVRGGGIRLRRGVPID